MRILVFDNYQTCPVPGEGYKIKINYLKICKVNFLHIPLNWKRLQGDGKLDVGSKVQQYKGKPI